MPHFDLGVYKHMKKSVRENMGVLASLGPKQKLSFNYQTYRFVIQTNAQRTVSNLFRVSHKASGANDDDLKFPVLALFYEAFRLGVKSVAPNVAAGYASRALLPAEIASGEQGMRTLRDTYTREGGKTEQVRKVTEILESIERMRTATQAADNAYGRLNRVFFTSADAVMSPEMKHIIEVCRADAEVIKYVSEACSANLPIFEEYQALHNAASQIYSKIYAVAKSVQPQEGTERRYFERLEQMIKSLTIGKNIEMMMQGTREDVPTYLARRDKETAWRIKKNIYAPAFSSQFFWLYIEGRIVDNDAIGARVYVSLFHNEAVHIEAMRIIVGFLVEQDRYRLSGGVKIGTLGSERNDTVVIYCSTFDVARAWSVELGSRLKGRGFARDTVPPFQKQVDKQIGVGVGAEPHLSIFLPPPIIEQEILPGGRRGSRLVIAPNPKFSFGTYLSGVIAVALARAANDHGGRIPSVRECGPYFATTFLKFGLDYLKPYRQPIADGNQSDRSRYTLESYLTM